MSSAEPNSYSMAWFEHFHVGIPEFRTANEVAFIRRYCPLPSFGRVLDVCCGMDRHARAPAAQGYSVTGVEREPRAVTAARQQSGGAIYVEADIRDYQPATEIFDSVVILSQSFGYFDTETNGAILCRLAVALRFGGRMILDLWNPEFFRTRQGEHYFQLAGGTVRETKRFVADRLFTRLDYPDGGYDNFEFQTFSPDQMAQFARPAGLTLIETRTDFSADAVPSADKPKVQYVLERV